MNNTFKVTIVEDENVIALLMKRNFDDLGCEVLEIIKSGEKAAQKIICNKPDLVLLDINLQGKDEGLDIMRTLYETFSPNFPIIVMTGYSNQDMVSEIHSLDPFAYYEKPIDIALLNDTVLELMELKSKKTVFCNNK